MKSARLEPSLNYLERARNSMGGWGIQPLMTTGLHTTSLAIRALAWDVTRRATVEDALAYLRRTYLDRLAECSLRDINDIVSALAGKLSEIEKQLLLSALDRIYDSCVSSEAL